MWKEGLCPQGVSNLVLGIRQIRCNYNYKEESDKWHQAVVIDLGCELESPGEL
jgi:hypothetical protein